VHLADLLFCCYSAAVLQITTVDEASQFYPLFGLGANVALIFSGRAVKIFSQIRAELPPDVDGWGLSLRGLMGMVVIGGLLIAGRCCCCWFHLVRTCYVCSICLKNTCTGLHAGNSSLMC
jgi:ATP/ADP translocase